MDHRRVHLAGAQNRLRDLEEQLAAAAPGSLGRWFWNEILEQVEVLPAAEEAAWKERNLPRLREVVVRPTPRSDGLAEADAEGEK